MVILINGASCTGKTYLAQKLMEKYKIPYISIDHIKMGLIRSGNTSLTVYDDNLLQIYLWDIVKEMVKTIIENNQNIIIEGGYMPFDYKKDFSLEYLNEIKYICLAMSEDYINNHFNIIVDKANIIENRGNLFSIDKQFLIDGNTRNIDSCIKYNLPLMLVKDKWIVDIDTISTILELK